MLSFIDTRHKCKIDTIHFYPLHFYDVFINLGMWYLGGLKIFDGASQLKIFPVFFSNNKISRHIVIYCLRPISEYQEKNKNKNKK